ncbi:c-type cytochrome [Marinobacterium arenosum]|uniref:c-type cytochrome n=1 Tax=Marinobacterium arenosum TaxID=2862496 RepID=UPI001C97E323|nr:c-type cytochrome [Marinobacterium arenosum]MBY4676494.1 c-type cytochrome [Marinobacterium arenosum]
MNKFTTALCALGLGFALASSAGAATSDEAIIERIKPLGSVCLEGDETCGGAAAAAATASAGGARSGADVYTQKCAACHAVGVAGAPKFGSADWTDRAAKGMETLLANAINGINAMPPRGTCADCSDEEIQGAIEHMIDSAK